MPINFGSLLSGFKSPAIPQVGAAPAPGTGFGALSALAPKASTPTASPYFKPTAAPTFGTPAIPNISGGPSISNDGMALQAPNSPAPVGVGTPGSRPAVPVIPGTTPAASAPSSPAVPSNPSVSPGAIVTTPSGATINQYTGALITPAPNAPPSSSSPTVPNSVFGTSTSGLSGYGTNGSPAVNSAVSALANLGSTNPANTGPGVAGYDTAVENLANFEATLQKQLGDVGSQAIPLPFIQGQKQVINTENAGILAALQGAVNQAQTGIQLQTAGAQTQGGILNEAGTLGASGQQLKQSALQEAGGLTAPVAGATFFGTPETGGMVGTGAGSMADAVALQAQKLQNGTTDPASAKAALAAYGQAGINALQTALGPNFNLNAAAGSAAAQQQNTELAGTATPAAEAQIYTKALGDYTDLQNYTANVDSFGSLLTGGMTAADGTTINPTDAKYANKTIAQFRDQLSSPAQAQFDSTLAALRAKVSGMLSIGGSETPTQLSSDANSIIDGSAPVGTLQATLSRIQDEGNALLTNQAKKVNDAKGKITPPSGTNFGTSGGGGSNSPFSSSNFFGS